MRDLVQRACHKILAVDHTVGMILGVVRRKVNRFFTPADENRFIVHKKALAKYAFEGL